MKKMHVLTSLEWRQTAKNSYEIAWLGSSGQLGDDDGCSDVEKDVVLTQDERFADKPWTVRIQSTDSPYQTWVKRKKGDMTHREALTWATDWLVRIALDTL